MTYVELIVVLSIFSIMSAIILFNYRGFQQKVDVKNLGSEVALKIVAAQKDAMSGKLPTPERYALITTPATWKPAYGVYFSRASVTDTKSFMYFTDLDRDGIFLDTSCSGTNECLEKTTITKGSISSLDAYFKDGSTSTLTSLTVLFTRPNSGPAFKSNIALPVTTVSYIQITVASSGTSTAKIKVYPSGRVQVN